MLRVRAPAVPPRCPYCQARHRSWRPIAAHRWPRHEWIYGDGPWASVSLCPGGGRGRDVTVQLYTTREAAEKAKEMIDASACGGRCWGAKGHRIVNLAAGSSEREGR